MTTTSMTASIYIQYSRLYILQITFFCCARWTEKPLHFPRLHVEHTSTRPDQPSEYNNLSFKWPTAFGSRDSSLRENYVNPSTFMLTMYVYLIPICLHFTVVHIVQKHILSCTYSHDDGG